MKQYEIVDTDAENIGGCGICGRKPGTTEGYRRKCDWLKKHYAEGVRFKVLCSRESGDIGVIEYAPGSHAWRPVEAEGYFVVHCLMVNREHRFIVDRERVLKKYEKGLTILAADQCPMVANIMLKRGDTKGYTDWRPVGAAGFRSLIRKLA